MSLFFQKLTHMCITLVLTWFFFFFLITFRFCILSVLRCMVIFEVQYRVCVIFFSSRDRRVTKSPTSISCSTLYCTTVFLVKKKRFNASAPTAKNSDTLKKK